LRLALPSAWAARALASGALASGALASRGWVDLERAWAEERARAPSSEDRNRRQRRRDALQRGCAYLAAAKLRRPDGGFGDDKAVVALTALTVLALQAGGSGYGRGPYGESVQRGIEFLLKLVETPDASGTFRPEGYFYHPADTDSRMHGQGYASLALATALGSAPGETATRLRAAVTKAVRCMERSQTATGGYGYDPSPDSNHEGSVTVCVAQALRAARDAGILVSHKTVLRGLDYLRRSQITSDGPDDGGFRYMEGHSKHSYALTAAAISSFFLFGRYKDEPTRIIERGMRYMWNQLDRGTADEEWYYYGHFYGAWAFWQRDGGDWTAGTAGTWWGKWAAKVIPELIQERQRTDGSWDDARSGRFAYGSVLATAFAVLTLSIPDEALPIFQR
jgi:hypothetical protein